VGGLERYGQLGKYAESISVFITIGEENNAAAGNQCSINQPIICSGNQMAAKSAKQYRPSGVGDGGGRRHFLIW